MSSTTRAWVQRVSVAAAWVTAILVWRHYQTSNDLSATSAGQNFIDAIDAAWWGLFAFVGVYLIRPIVLFPASVITIMAGVLFGPWVGVLVVVIAANASAMIAFTIGRLLGARPAESEGSDGFVQRWSQKLRDNSFETVFIMRLIFLPYDLVSYLCGALHIRWTAFLIATALGSLPGTISFVLLGASLERIDMGLDGINPIAIAAGVAIFILSLVISRVVSTHYSAAPEPT